ncbi:MAG: uridine kinase [Tissierellia bacterium]|nr:uridine kinase [Tissierellia bacterium]
MKDYKYIEIKNDIYKLLKSKKQVLIAIDGNCCAGKTTLADMINKEYDSNIFHMDDFFLREELKTPERLEEVGGNVDYVRFKNEVLENIIKNTEFKYQIYNCKIEALDKYVLVKPKQLNIIEGSYSMHLTLINFYDYKIFLTLDKDTQVKRVLERNGIEMLQPFVNQWIPMEDEYFSKFKIKDSADIVIE